MRLFPQSRPRSGASVRTSRLAIVPCLLLALACSAQDQPAAVPNSSTRKSQSNIPDSPSPARKNEDPDLALKRAVAEAQNDRAALVHNLEAYLVRFPDGPRNAAVYRALVESCEQLNDNACALENAERLIAVHPDDSDMMLVAV